MALRVDLKPHEKMVIGKSVITNGDQRTRLSIEGSEPILRAKDIILPEEADTPCKRIYVLIQAMYLSDDPKQYHSEYFDNAKEIISAAPSTLNHFESINNHILTNDLYKALRAAKSLIEYEEGLMSDASGGKSLPENAATDGHAPST